MVTLPSDFSGALHQVLSAFAWRKLNLTKIESRPTKTGLGNYFFIIDVEGLMDDVLIPGVVSELRSTWVWRRHSWKLSMLSHY